MEIKKTYQKARASKPIVTIFFCCLLLLSVGGVWALTTITDTGIVTPTGDYTNITADSINEVFYVMAGNASDIQAKIDLVESIGSGIVIIPCGSYIISSQINMVSNVTVSGDGTCTKITSNEVSIFAMSNSKTHENILIENMYIDMNSSSKKILIGNNRTNNNIQLRNVYAINGDDWAINIYGNNIRINDNTFLNFKRGIAVEGEYTYITGNKITSDGNSTTGAELEGIDLNDASISKYGWISHNDIDGFHEESIDCNAIYCTVVDNKILRPIGSNLGGITISGNNSIATNNIILNVSGRSGIELHSQCYECEVSNNIIKGNGTSVGIKADGVNGSVSNNIIIDSNTGISNGGIDIQFIGNKFIGVTTKFSSLPSEGFNFYDSVFNMQGQFIIDQNNNERSLTIDTESTSSSGLLILGDAVRDGTGVNSLAYFRLDDPSSTGYVLEIDNDGIGRGLNINQDGNGIGLNIDSEGDKSPIRIEGNSTGIPCDATNEGGLYYDGTLNKHLGCDGSTWNALY